MSVSCTCDNRGDIPEEFRDPDQPVTDELLTKLAEALGIKWPEWYRRLIVAFDGKPPSYLFDGADAIYSDLMRKRSGETGLAEPLSPGEWRDLPWPANLIGVGSVANAEVVIDTTSEDGELLQRRFDRRAIEPLGNILSRGPTPEAVATILMEEQRAADVEHERRLKQKQWEMANPIFRGPPPGT